jgi:hypothetical protein
VPEGAGLLGLGDCAVEGGDDDGPVAAAGAGASNRSRSKPLALDPAAAIARLPISSAVPRGTNRNDGGTGRAKSPRTSRRRLASKDSRRLVCCSAARNVSHPTKADTSSLRSGAASGPLMLTESSGRERIKAFTAG